jgi:RNA polymerase sigma-70 factor (ECF subfamily)
MIQVADFEAIFIRFQLPITNFIAHTIGNREQAFDLAQDVFVKAYKSLLGGTTIPQRALAAWLYRIAANTITDTLRRQHLIAWLPLNQDSFEGGRFEERVADRQIIERVLWGMSPKYSTCLLLYEHEGLSCPEIAEVLHINLSAAKMRLVRSRKQFLTLYQKEIGT